MLRLLTLFIGAILLIGCGHKNEYTISGNISDTIIDGNFVYMYDGNKVIDSAKVVDNSFEFTGIADSVVFAEITYDTQSWKTSGIIALEPGDIEIILNNHNSSTAATGTVLNDAINEYTAKKVAIETNLRTKYEKTITDKTLDKRQQQRQIDQVNKSYFDQTKDVVIQAIIENLDNEASALFLSDNYPNTVNDMQFGELYSKMSARIKTRHELKKAYLRYKTNTTIIK